MLNLALIVKQKSLNSFYSFFETKKDEIRSLIKQKVKIDYIYSENENLFNNSLIKDKSIQITKNYKQILLDQKIDLILELNKSEKSLFFIKEALKNKKNFISTNAEVLANNYSVIKKIEKENQAQVYFSALFSPLPIANLINYCYPLAKLKQLTAIINPNTNYILAKMSENTVSMKETVADFKKTEKISENQELDLEGANSFYKTILLANLIYGISLSPKEFKLNGIKGITSYDLIYADELGYKIKLISMIKRKNKNLYLSVRPHLVAKNSLFATNNKTNSLFEFVFQPDNRVVFEAEKNNNDFYDLLFLDIINAAKNYKQKNELNLTNQIQVADHYDFYDYQANKFYLRLQLEKNKDIIKQIKDIFSEKNLAELILHDNLTETPLMPVVIITKNIQEKKLKKILEEVEKLEGVLTVNNIIPIQVKQ